LGICSTDDIVSTEGSFIREEEEEETDGPSSTSPSAVPEAHSSTCPSTSRPYGSPIGHFETRFHRHRAEQQHQNLPPWHPFEDRDEWELAKWLVESGLSQTEIDTFLKLNIVSQALEDYCCILAYLLQIQLKVNPSFSSKYLFFSRIDELPDGAKWMMRKIRVQGDKLDAEGNRRGETLELWMRDLAEVARELIGDPAFLGHIQYSFQMVFVDGRNGPERGFNEMWTADWWRVTEVWRYTYCQKILVLIFAQARLPNGATLIPIILASDKTKLGNFCGNKQAWPVYATIGNIAKHIRRKVSSGASMLVGYLPVTKLECYKKATRPKALVNLFHVCMKMVVRPLEKPGLEGMLVGCSDQLTRRGHPLLGAYVADNPEQCLVACVKQNRCHVGTVEPDKRGDFMPCHLRDVARTISELLAKMYGTTTDTFIENGLNGADSPFWAALPYCIIFILLTPDLLHQFHRGGFADHLLEWNTTIIGKEEIDRRYMAMPSHPAVRHFGSGVSGLSQTNGTEQKEIEKVFVAAVYGASPALVRASVGLLDFIHLANLPTHTSSTITALGDALRRFHVDKNIFIELGGRALPHFNLNKIHSFLHYPSFILSHGALDGYNTEWSERLHIEFTKNAYRATNHINYTPQMTAWLRRHEKVSRFSSYLDWSSPSSDVPQVTGTPSTTIQGFNIVYEVARSPPFPSCTGTTLSLRFGCDQLEEAMNVYLQAQGCAATSTSDDTYDVYTRLNLRHTAKDAYLGVTAPDECIRAGPGLASSNEAAFDTVLMHYTSDSSCPIRKLILRPSHGSCTLIKLLSSLSGCSHSSVRMPTHQQPATRAAGIRRMVHRPSACFAC
jgi:hypothetical protein